ncbi:MAG: hypothetical protein II652_00945 [Bacteroidales bacterium]|nr:hypothetical protein [Bacteroidales bacterium]
MLTLEKGGLRIFLAAPGEYYRGTRFDHAGVFRAIYKAGRNYADEWFPVYDPLKHDAVCGPSEEFGEIGFDEAAPGGSFLKPGIGWLRRPDGEAYDRFRLYKLLDEGVRTTEVREDSVVFGQRLDRYNYLKTIRLNGNDSFEIIHSLENLGDTPLKCTHYNHNFFTLSNDSVGPSREIDFPFRPDGHWRSEYDNVRLTENGIRFTGAVPQEGPSVFMGDLHAASRMVEPIDFKVRDLGSGLGVRVSCPLPFTHIVFWSNDRVACIEPYILLDIAPGQSAEWTLTYRLF